MSKDLLKMLENEHFADVTFVVGDTKVKAHKCILASRSNFFENKRVTCNNSQSITRDVQLNQGI